MAIDPKKTEEWKAALEKAYQDGIGSAEALAALDLSPGDLLALLAEREDPERAFAILREAIWSDPPSFADLAQKAVDALGNADADIDRLRAERVEMLALLRQVEWADNSADEYVACCPSCGGASPVSARDHQGDYPVGHLPECRLAAFLKPEKE